MKLRNLSIIVTYPYSAAVYFMKTSITITIKRTCIQCKIIFTKCLYRWDKLEDNHSKDDISLLLNPKPFTPPLYFLPKIHNPGCPIIAFFSSSTKRVSAYIDAHLQPIVKSLPSYIKDKGPSINYVTRISRIFTPSPSLSQVVKFLRPPHPLPSVTSHILEFYT